MAALSDKHPAPWASSIASVVAFSASCSLHPLENIKLRLMASDKAQNNPIPGYIGIWHAMSTMYRQEGIRSLYRGVVLHTLTGSLSNSIFFFVYADGKQRYNIDNSNPQSWKTMFISLRAGLVAQIFKVPLWVIKTRLVLHREALSPQNGPLIYQVVKDMVVNEGPRAFFKGFVPAMFLSSYNVIAMYSYENINHLFGYQSGSRKMSKENFLIPFLTGGASKSLASFVLMPLNVVRLRMQMKQYSTDQVKTLGIQVKDNRNKTVQYKGMVDCFVKILRNEGVLAFYKGITPNILRVFPSQGIFFVVYEGTLQQLAKWSD